jgi:hypothetical protein
LTSDTANDDAAKIASIRCRFGTSQCVPYRYGAFRDRFQVEADGSRTHILVDANGAEIADERRPAFRLPPGVTDPFATPTERPAGGPLTIGGYTIESVVQHANSGGAYRFRTPDDQPVFLKEARHTMGTRRMAPTRAPG